MKTMHRFVLAVGIVTGLTTLSLRAQDPITAAEQTFRSAIDVVTIQASVRDTRGRIVSGLTPTDFEVLDNGQARPILSLRADNQAPLSIAVLVDMSGSMAIRPKMDMARQAYESILSELRQGQDEVALFTFDASLHERRDFTDDLATLKGALSGFAAFGTTSLYDATAAAARRLAARSGTHKAIIVLTDGLDTSSAMSAREVSGLSSSIDVPVFVVATVPSLDQRFMLEASGRSTPSATADLRDLADWTGGELLFASSLTETTKTSSKLIGDLRQQYVLAIEAADAREWRRLEVRVRRPSAIVRARSGYFAG